MDQQPEGSHLAMIMPMDQRAQALEEALEEEEGSSLAEERGLASFLSLIAPSICRHRSNSARQFANFAVTQGGPLLSMLGRTLPGLARQSTN